MWAEPSIKARTGNQGVPRSDLRHNRAVSRGFVVGLIGLVGLGGLAGLLGCGAELNEPGVNPNVLPDATVRDAATDAPPVIDARPCMGGMAAKQEPGGACFVLFPGPKVRAEAELDCVALGGHLATVKTAASNAIVASLVIATPSAFLGGNDLTTENAFVWPDGTAVAYTNWRTGEPNNSNGNGFEEDCMVIQGLLGGVWDDRPCAPPPVGTGSYAYVCSY